MIPNMKKNKDMVLPRERTGFLLDEYQPKKYAVAQIAKIRNAYIMKDHDNGLNSTIGARELLEPKAAASPKLVPGL